MTKLPLAPSTFEPDATTRFPRWRGALLVILGFAAAIGFLAQVSRTPAPNPHALAAGSAPAQVSVAAAR